VHSIWSLSARTLVARIRIRTSRIYRVGKFLGKGRGLWSLVSFALFSFGGRALRTERLRGSRTCECSRLILRVKHFVVKVSPGKGRGLSGRPWKEKGKPTRVV